MWREPYPLYPPLLSVGEGEEKERGASAPLKRPLNFKNRKPAGTFMTMPAGYSQLLLIFYTLGIYHGYGAVRRDRIPVNLICGDLGIVP